MKSTPDEELRADAWMRLYHLLATALDYPDLKLVKDLVTGSFFAEMSRSLSDLGFAEPVVEMNALKQADGGGGISKKIFSWSWKKTTRACF